MSGTHITLFFCYTLQSFLLMEWRIRKHRMHLLIDMFQYYFFMYLILNTKFTLISIKRCIQDVNLFRKCKNTFLKIQIYFHIFYSPLNIQNIK